MIINQRQLLPHERDSMLIVSEFSNPEVVARHAPSLFAMSGHPKMSNNYGYTNTYALLQYLINRGFIIRSVQQTGRGEFGRVMVRMTHPHMYRDRDGEAQLIIIDSHDGTAALKVVLGWFRFVCANGMIVGDAIFNTKYKHTQDDLIEAVLLDLDDAMLASDRLTSRVDKMKERELSSAEVAQFAEAVARLRYDFGDDDARYPRAAMALLPTRRSEDTVPSLFVTMNRLQENAMRGGMVYTYKGLGHKVKPMSSINGQMELNQGIWQEAMKLLEAA
jgi:hypothetical protein